MVARKVIYSGTVQGVAFRRRAEDTARDFEVSGYVMNLADGTVELVAQGPKDVVRAFLDRVAARMHREIRAVREFEVATSDLKGFAIRR